MHITVSVPGRFHAFYLADQLQRRGHLARLITSYPKVAVRPYGIPDAKICSLVLKEALARAHALLPQRLQWKPLDYHLGDWFDRRAAQRLPDADLCVAWSGFGLHTLRRARAAGAVTVLERCSSHIEFQRDILVEEYALQGLDVTPVLPLVVEKELVEYGEADYIAVPSSFAKRTFVERGVPPAKVIQVPYGVDVEVFRPLQKPDNVFRVLSVGAQSVRKGTAYLVRAFAELKLPHAELLTVGTVERQIRPVLGSVKGVRSVRSVPQSALPEYYRQGSVFVLCSVEEGLAMVQAQAMACGLPIICTTNTGGADVVRDGVDGFVIPIRDVEALKEKLLYLYEHPDVCRAMGESALARVRGGYSWDDYGTGITAEYQAALTHAGTADRSFR